MLTSFACKRSNYFCAEGGMPTIQCKHPHKEASFYWMSARFQALLVSARTIFVPKAGLEPARSCEHTPLKRACLPISPLRHSKFQLGKNSLIPELIAPGPGFSASFGSIYKNSIYKTRSLSLFEFVKNKDDPIQTSFGYYCTPLCKRAFEMCIRDRYCK